ncbi:class I SAM-dependent methyltransferase [Eoetvoesiella caeni]
MSSRTSIPTGLPSLDPDSTAHAKAVERYLVEQIEQAPWGFMPFEQWMSLALYAPGLGYYAAGNTKFGGASLGAAPQPPSGDFTTAQPTRKSLGLVVQPPDGDFTTAQPTRKSLGSVVQPPDGDFTTAPELTPLFARVVGGQVGQVLRACGSLRVLEFGAGSGAMAAGLIPALREQGIEPEYQILEVSADLRARQQQRLEQFGSAVTWLDELPTSFVGCVLANEVLDAMPVTLFRWDDTGNVLELGVTLGHSHTQEDDISLRHRRAGGVEASQGHAHLEDGLNTDNATPFLLAERLARPELAQAVAKRMPPLPEYQSEINLQAEAWVRQLGSWLEKGAALLIDYGFPQGEYYHPQRTAGTLMCHFRHHAHTQPLIYPGLQDITAHVDFTAMADAALEGGLDVLGYTSQARFLMNAGLPELLAHLDPEDIANYAPTVSAVQKLISEAEMGELFKVLAIGKDIDVPLIGFASGDRRHRL